MKNSKRISLFVSVCLVVVVGGLALLGLFLLQRRPLLLYVTGLDSKDSISLLDPQASPCAQPQPLLEAEFGTLDYVRWTPQRDQIIYVQQTSKAEMASLWIMRSDGTKCRQLTPLLPSEFKPQDMQVSPDQRYVALLRDYVPEDITQPRQMETYILDTQTGNWRQIMTKTLGFAWSPIQNVLAVYRWGDGKIYIIHPNGSVIREYPTDLPDSRPIWSPDGQQIAFISNSPPEHTMVSEIYSINVQSGQIRRLTKTASAYYDRLISSFSWSPDGRYIAFHVSTYLKVDGAKEAHTLFVLDVETGREVRLADHVKWTAPVWSPDGKEIAFVSTKDGSNYGQIYTVDMVSGKITQHTCYDGIKLSLSW